MGIINQLDTQTANLIAAGEVVDRPASACKELLENSIDAGASVITVEIKNGGVSLIRVTDNGKGMAREDVPICIRRHATSKLRTFSDLNRIMTLGFRGEALAAISSVAHMRILTKRKIDPVGTMLECGPGEEPTISEVAISDGTTIVVENLFENFPARRKFLKRDRNEAMAVQSALERVALAYPAISIRLIVDNQQKFFTVGDNLLKSAIYSIYGREFANRMLPIDHHFNDIHIYGFVGTPDNVRGNRNYQNFFVNRRFVRSKCAAAAIEQAYTSYSPSEKFPTGVVFIDLPPEMVDVNVHPTKLEVKFANEKQIFESVYYAARSALMSAVKLPKLKIGEEDQQSESDQTLSDRKTKQLNLLNSFTAVLDTPEPTEKRPYLNQKNVMQGQLSFVDQPEAAVEEASKSSDLTENPTDPTELDPQIESIEPSEQSAQTAEATPPDDDFSEEEFNRQYDEAVRAELGLKPDDPKLPSTADDDTLTDDLPPEIAELQGHTPRSRRKMPYYPRKKGELLNDPEPPSDEDRTYLPSKTDPISPSITESPEVFDAAEPDFSSIYPKTVQNAEAPQPDNRLPISEQTQIEDLSTDQLHSFPQKPNEDFRIVGEVFYSYVFVERGNSVYIIDKHAAHERILFEELKQNYQSSSVSSQLMLVPLTVQMTPDELQAISDHSKEIRALGFEFNIVQQNSVEVHGIPQQTAPDSARNILETLAGQLASGTGSAEISNQLMFEKALYQASCKAAIKAGKLEDIEHLKWIVDKIFKLDAIRFCPHGRPVAFEMTKANIERQFKRT